MVRTPKNKKSKVPGNKAQKTKKVVKKKRDHTKTKTDLLNEEKPISVNKEKALIKKGLLPEPIPKCKLKKITDQVLKRGRPIKYKEEFCETALQVLSQGKTLESLAIELAISWSTLHDWIDNFEEFSYAIKEGQKLSEQWWVEVGRKNIHNKDFNSTLFMMNMQNRFNWTRKLEGKITKTDHTINETKNTLEVNLQTNENIAEIARILGEAGAFQSTDEDSPDSKTH